MEPEQFVEHVLRLAKPSEQVNAGSADDRLLYLLSETCTQQLRRRQSEMLATSRGKPVLLCYMSDGWGSNIVTRITSKVGELVLRNARFRHEFLLQIALMKVFGADGSVETAVLVDGAVSLRHGKRSEHGSASQLAANSWPSVGSRATTASSQPSTSSMACCASRSVGTFARGTGCTTASTGPWEVQSTCSAV